MAFTYDVSTSRGQVRMLVPDRNYDTYIFEDEEIDAFLSLESSDVRKAAAMALETIASDQALTLKVIRILELQTDGAKLADALMKRAAQLRSLAAEADDDYGFDVAELVYDDFSARERLEKEALRDA